MSVMDLVHGVDQVVKDVSCGKGCRVFGEAQPRDKEGIEHRESRMELRC